MYKITYRKRPIPMLIGQERIVILDSTSLWHIIHIPWLD